MQSRLLLLLFTALPGAGWRDGSAIIVTGLPKDRVQFPAPSSGDPRPPVTPVPEIQLPLPAAGTCTKDAYHNTYIVKNNEKINL